MSATEEPKSSYDGTGPLAQMQSAVSGQGCSSAIDTTSGEQVSDKIAINQQLTIDQKIVSLEQAINPQVSKTARNDLTTEEKKGVKTFKSEERANSECVNSDSQSSGDEEIVSSVKNPISQLNSMTVTYDAFGDQSSPALESLKGKQNSNQIYFHLFQSDSFCRLNYRSFRP